MSSTRRRFGCATLLMLALALPVGYFALFLYAWRDQSPRGQLVSSQDWPAPIRELHAAMKKQVQVPAFEVYLLQGQPTWTVSTVMCRVEDAPGVLDFLKAKLKLRAVPAENTWSNLFFTSALPGDWRPASRAGSEYYASRHWLAGGEGTLFAVARDPQTRRLFLYYSFNF